MVCETNGVSEYSIVTIFLWGSPPTSLHLTCKNMKLHKL